MSAPSTSRPTLAPLLRVLLAVVFSFVLMEGFARLAGFRPWDPRPAPIRIEPGGSLFEPDPRLGYRHRAGEFRVTQEELRFSLHHGPDTLRRTSEAPLEGDGRPGLWIFGGSFTHGWAVEDAQTFPWLLQERLPGFRVTNFGVSGYGTLHSLLQLEAALQSRPPPPAVVVLAYSSFHHRRNVFSRERRKIIVPWNHLGPLQQPVALFDARDELVLGMSETTYRELPGMRWSAVLHLAEQALNRLEARRLREEDVTFALVERIAELAERNRFGLLIAGISPDEVSRAMLERCAAAGMLTADVSHDWLDPAFNNLPWDSHPNARGQAMYARALLRALRERGLVPPARPGAGSS